MTAVTSNYSFQGPHGLSLCDLTLVFSSEMPGHIDHIIATEVDYNPGLSITNAAEHLWREVRAEDPGDYRIWEHYPETPGFRESWTEVIIDAEGNVGWIHVLRADLPFLDELP